jgi:hypothetical protein
MDGTPSWADWIALAVVGVSVGVWWLAVRLLDGPRTESSHVPPRLYAVTAGVAFVPALIAFLSGVPDPTFWWWMVWAYPAAITLGVLLGVSWVAASGLATLWPELDARDRRVATAYTAVIATGLLGGPVVAVVVTPAADDLRLGATAGVAFAFLIYAALQRLARHWGTARAE